MSYLQKRLEETIKNAREGKYATFVFEPVAFSTHADGQLSVFVFDPESNKKLWESLHTIALASCKGKPEVRKAWHSNSLECTLVKEAKDA